MPSGPANALHYPLSNTFFGRFPLQPHRLAAIDQDATELIAQFVSTVLNPDDRSMLWRDIGVHDGAQLYEGDILGLNLTRAGIAPFRGVSRIYGTTIDEVSQLYRFDSREDCIEFVELHQADILHDLMTLYTIRRRLSDAPYKSTYIQWAAASSPLPQVCRDRDFVFIEAQDEIILSSGRRAWVSCQRSIDLDNVPALSDTSLQLMRGEITLSGLLVMETERVGELDVIYHFAADLKGRMAGWARKMLFKRRMLAITSLAESIHKLRFSHQPLKTQQECMWEVPKPASYFKSCALCYSVARFRRHECCQSCTQAVCNKCSRVYQLRRSSVNSQSKARICTSCTTAYRSYALKRHYSVSSPYESTLSSSMVYHNTASPSPMSVVGSTKKNNNSFALRTHATGSYESTRLTSTSQNNYSIAKEKLFADPVSEPTDLSYVHSILHRSEVGNLTLLGDDVASMVEQLEKMVLKEGP
ncbi:hypothetical protein THRCLA_03656 [Thraustotheca clavata]|uniref:FYVE-type domain-containing protein n=1 Tax=Thraustotheca clavata TaxID=74557 RepID=A0A1W0A1D4_9STRA|nr:hypothetical protein THRCLA_03656 [Thraustotheca clavata]